MSESMALEWEQWLQLEKSNVAMIEQRLQDLSSNHDSPAGFQYSEFWAEAEQVRDMFGALVPLPNDDRERLLAAYERICEGARARHQKESNVRRAKSQQKRRIIERKMAEANSCADSAPSDIGHLSRAIALLGQARALMGTNAADGAEDTEQDATTPAMEFGLTAADRQACQAKWQEAHGTICARRQALWDSNYEPLSQETQQALNEANDGSPFDALERVKEAQRRLREAPISRSQSDTLRGILNQAWDIAAAKASSIRQARKRKHDEWLGRIASSIGRWEEDVKRNKEETADLLVQINGIRTGMRNPNAKEHAEVLRAWIAEKRQRIRQIEEINKEIEERIREARDQLNNER